MRKALLIIIIILVAGSYCFAVKCNWQAEPPMGTARNQFTGGVINGKIYVFGGNGNPNGINLNSTEVYDPNTGLWTYLADNDDNGGDGVEELTSAVVNGKLYVFGAYGGIGPSGNYGDINFNEIYNPNTDTWTTLAQKPTLVSGAPATVYNGEIYLFGGGYSYDGMPEVRIYYSVVEAYNPASNTWRFVTNMPKAIVSPGLATIGTKAYLFGGYDPNLGQFLNNVISYDFQAGIWTVNGYASLPIAKVFAYSSTAPVVNGKVYLIGGVDAVENGELTYSSTTDIYNPSTNSWSKGSPLPLPLSDNLSVGIGGTIYVLGGDNSESFVNASKSEVISLSTPCLTPSIADLNADGIVNFADLAILASSWLEQTAPQ